MNQSISKPIKNRKPKPQLSFEMRDFLTDYHSFTNKWPTQKIAELPEINTSRQNVYKATKKKGKHAK